MSKKMSAILTLAGLLTVVFSVTSCGGPFWEKPITSVEQSVVDNRLLGAWQEFRVKNGENVGVLEIAKAQHGLMVFAYCGRPWVGESTGMLGGYFHVSKLNGRHFMNIRMFGEKGMLSEKFMILEYEIKNEELQLYAPNLDPLINATQTEDLSGFMEFKKEGWYLIHCESGHIRKFITRYPSEKLFYPHISPPVICLRKMR